MKISWSKALFAGFVATTAMTMVGLYVAPMMHIPRMNPAAMLAGAMGGSSVLGWAGHYMIGTVLAITYALVAAHLVGVPWVRGALFSTAPWLLAQLVVIPMMGMIGTEPTHGTCTALRCAWQIPHCAAACSTRCCMRRNS